jgi:hypothetical protein
VKIRAKPTMSAVLGRSPRAGTVATTPTHGRGQRARAAVANDLEQLLRDGPSARTVFLTSYAAKLLVNP